MATNDKADFADRKPALTTERVAEILSMEAQTLARWRTRGKGPKFMKLPGGFIRYRQSDVDEFVNAHVVDPVTRLATANRVRRRQHRIAPPEPAPPAANSRRPAA